MQLQCMWSGNLRLDRLQRTFCKGRFIGPGTHVTSCQGAMQSYYIKQVLINFSVSFSTDPINDRTMLPFSLQLTCANIWLIFKHLNLHIQIITSLILTLPRSSLQTLQDEKKRIQAWAWLLCVQWQTNGKQKPYLYSKLCSSTLT